MSCISLESTITLEGINILTSYSACCNIFFKFEDRLCQITLPCLSSTNCVKYQESIEFLSKSIMVSPTQMDAVFLKFKYIQFQYHLKRGNSYNFCLCLAKYMHYTQRPFQYLPKRLFRQRHYFQNSGGILLVHHWLARER